LDLAATADIEVAGLDIIDTAEGRRPSLLANRHQAPDG
jgi:hypothetical protein